MRKIIAPSKYFQGPGALGKLPELTGSLGSRPLMITGENSAEALKKHMTFMTEESPESFLMVQNRGHCCEKEIDRICRLAREKNADFIIGAGGGRIIDTAKAAASFLDLPLVICPTSAATDAACSALSVLYTEKGEYDRVLYMDRNPDMVIVDSKVIMEAPERLFVSGMGDALATYFEARAVKRSSSLNQTGGMPTESAFKLAESCFELLLRDGRQALEDMRRGRLSQAVENVIEANTYMSAVGFESGGLAAAHALQNGLTAIDEVRESLHGERVAFCLLAQLVLEEAEEAEIQQLAAFIRDVGLPLQLSDLGIKEPYEDKIAKAAEKACEQGSNIYKMPLEITVEKVAKAMLEADKIKLTG